MGRQLVLTEHQSLSGVSLTQGEVNTLLASDARIGIRPLRGASGLYELRPGSHVGLITAGDLVVEIRPKVSIDRLLFLLSYGAEHARWPGTAVGASADATLSEVLAAMFARLLRGALARGVLQGYHTEEDALPGVRGRIRFDDQLRTRFGLAPPVEVRFDEFTEDIEANRILKSALHVLGRVGRHSPTSRRSLRVPGQLLGRVSLVEYLAGRVPAIHFDRLNAHYEPAIRFAELILQGASIELSHGDVAATSVLFNMNAVFESFVRRGLREALGLDRLRFPRPGTAPALFLDAAAHIRLKPDLSWWDGKRCIFVGDAKYKRLAAAGFLHADTYQVLAYLVATGLDEGLLIYAKGEDTPTEHVIRHADKTIRVRTLDLEGSEADLRKQMNTLAEETRSITRPVATHTG